MASATYYWVVIDRDHDAHVYAPGDWLTWFSESAACAEGTFRYQICKETTSFWPALAFMLVKGNTQHMPPMLTYNKISENPSETAANSLADCFHHSLAVSPPSPQTTSMPSHASSSTSDSTLFHTSSASQGTPIPPSTSHSGTEVAAASPIIYSRVHTLCGVVSSNYYPTLTAHVRHLTRPLGELDARYLASHGYGTDDVKHILQAYSHARSNEDLVTFLAGQDQHDLIQHNIICR
ncbi:hypothetical protein EDC04DRAFT_2605336 [Pisolithus marmoratus]|nr:hypothetical protein EDC04DRAFT_2605336 [Pisolithus marmoratus]